MARESWRMSKLHIQFIRINWMDCEGAANKETLSTNRNLTWPVLDIVMSRRATVTNDK